MLYIIIILSRYDNGGRYYTLTSAPLNPRDDHIVGANSVKGTREMAENKRLSSSSVAAPAQSFRLINAVRCKYSLANIRPSRLLITIAITTIIIMTTIIIPRASLYGCCLWAVVRRVAKYDDVPCRDFGFPVETAA